MSTTTKSKVLAKCGELAPEFALKNIPIAGCSDWIIERMAMIGQLWWLKNGGIIYRLDYEAPEDDPVWALAHAVLFGEKPEERPSEGVLWEAFERGNMLGHCEHGKAKEQFTKWLETLPPDPLAADRELVWKAWLSGEINLYTKETAEALSRLCGMEGGAK